MSIFPINLKLAYELAPTTSKQIQSIDDELKDLYS
jgi:hypothetical protein